MPFSRTVCLALALATLPVEARAPTSERRVSLDFVRVPVNRVLQGLAEVGRVNLVLSDTVQGTVTLTVRDVPWTQALRGVVAARGLGMELSGGILRVAPLAEFQAEAESRRRLTQGREQEGPLRTWFFPVSYARASEVAPRVQAMLSPRGRVSVDERTNTLIIVDVDAPSPP